MRSFKTTLAGIALGAIPIGHEVLNMIAGGTHIDWKQVLLGIGFIALGGLAKDADKTGTTKTF
jgi:hypothetical protein